MRFNIICALLIFSVKFYLSDSQAGAPIKCAANEEYSTCGTACPDICNAKTPLKCSISDCIVGCFCKKGWVRNKDGACVKPNECVPDPPEEVVKPKPIKCTGVNETYVICGTACQWTCDNWNASVWCTYPCQPGCFCLPGNVRDSRNVCIPASRCPPVGTCKIASNLEALPLPGETCENNCVERVKCIAPPPGKCNCQFGYFRDSQGQCVPLERCPRGCNGTNEIYDSRVLPDLKCNSLKVKPVAKVNATEECYCKSGFARNVKNECIAVGSCPKK